MSLQHERRYHVLTTRATTSMGDKRNTTKSRQRKGAGSGSQYPALRPLLGLASLIAALPSCAILHPRPLTFKEQTIPIVRRDPEKAAELQRDCRPVGEVETFDNELDARRRAGEQRASVVQDLYEPPKRPKPPEHAGVAGPGICSTYHFSDMGTPLFTRTDCSQAFDIDGEIVELRCITESSCSGGPFRINGQQLNVHCTVTAGAADCSYSPFVKEAPSHGLEVRFWQCPASPAKPNKGEVVWRMEPKTVFGQAMVPRLQMMRDGQVVSHGDEGFKGLSNIVAACPSAVLHAKRAEELGHSALVDGYLGKGLGLAFLASTGVAVAGYFRHDRYLLWPGVGGMVVLSFPILGFSDKSGLNLGREAATEAMEAADLYNDGCVNSR